MAKTKHVPDASVLIDDYFSAQPLWSRQICDKLRSIILSSDKKMIEDWKWGPNYNCEGMVCGLGIFKKHVNLVFFQGTMIEDRYRLFEEYKGTVHNRHIKFTDISQIKEEQILDYVFQAIDNNRKGKKLVAAKDKTLKIPSDVKKELLKNGLSKIFEGRTYSRRKELVMWIVDAKRPETRASRINKMIDHLRKKI
jgi:uncharacterized protein YdeI (YjbR/CyaY-like superfamily)